LHCWDSVSTYATKPLDIAALQILLDTAAHPPVAMQEEPLILSRKK
jgi:hypothetical protein